MNWTAVWSSGSVLTPRFSMNELRVATGARSAYELGAGAVARQSSLPSEDDGEIRVLDEHDLLLDSLAPDLRPRESRVSFATCARGRVSVQRRGELTLMGQVPRFVIPEKP